VREAEEAAAAAAGRSAPPPPPAAAVVDENARRELRLVIKGDVSGSVEAVAGALEGIGNDRAGVKIVHTGVGNVSESDVQLAETAQGAFWSRICGTGRG
jgi:translation initiation factor IF-2